MTDYSDAYKKGVLHKEQGKPMEVPSALNNIGEFRGYFDGYGGHKYNPPERKPAH